MLLGRRHRRAAFLPDIYVFPGGRVEPSDRTPSGFAEVLPPPLGRQLAADRPARDPLAYVRAAIRETFEETGLLVAEPSAPPSAPSSPPDPPVGAAWAAFAARGLVPAFSRLAYVCRAVSPAALPRRYNTRFFLARDAAVRGRLAGDGELDDLGWRPLAEIPRLGLIDVTAFVLAEALRLWLDGRPAAGMPPLACYRASAFRVRRRGG